MKSIVKFFSTKSVKEKLLKGTLSEGQLFIYFYLIMMYDAVGLTQQCLTIIGKQPSVIDLVNIWGYLIITGIGLLMLFLANGGVKGKNFLSKFFSFSFTVGLKYAIAFIILDALSKLIPPALIQPYEVTIYFLVNILMRRFKYEAQF